MITSTLILILTRWQTRAAPTRQARLAQPLYPPCPLSPPPRPLLPTRRRGRRCCVAPSISASAKHPLLDSAATTTMRATIERAKTAFVKNLDLGSIDLGIDLGINIYWPMWMMVMTVTTMTTHCWLSRCGRCRAKRAAWSERSRLSLARRRRLPHLMQQLVLCVIGVDVTVGHCNCFSETAWFVEGDVVWR